MREEYGLDRSAADPDAVYHERLERCDRAAADSARRGRHLGWARLAAFLAAGAVAAGAVLGAPSPRPTLLAAAGALLAAFAVLVALDARVGRRRRREEALAAVNRRALARRARDWDALAGEADGGEEVAAAAEAAAATAAPVGAGLDTATARDLGIAGRASLFRLLGTLATAGGRQTLARWLVAPADPTEVGARQAAVAALAPALAWRQGLEAAGRVGELERRGAVPDLERFESWLAEEPWLAGRPWALWAARLLAIVVPAGIVAHIVGLAGWSAWVYPALAAYLLSAVFSKRIESTFDRASAGGDGLRGYGELFQRLGELPGGAARLETMRRRLTAGDRSAAVWMDRLERLVVLADARHGAIHFVIQVLVCWDFHLVARFEAWRRVAGASARGWLETLAEAEALSALAELAYAQPDWTFPEIDPTAGSVTAAALGHPLIPAAVRVANDVTIGPPGTFLLVTGSNMSGKTTLLRAVGTNAVLAQAGGPVAARRLVLPPVALATSVVVEDDLERGVSFFLAELLRLKRVVETAGAPLPGRRTLYLLDEILRGTNSAERRVAVARVIGRLVEVGAIGAVTTHDLEILAEGALAGAAQTVHFRETVNPRAEGGADMTFDYRLRPGLAPTTNALRLLAAVGIEGVAGVDGLDGPGDRAGEPSAEAEGVAAGEAETEPR